jgi:hypothetical protein
VCIENLKVMNFNLCLRVSAKVCVTVFEFGWQMVLPSQRMVASAEYRIWKGLPTRDLNLSQL